jgi:cyclohexanone monooxygenase
VARTDEGLGFDPDALLRRYAEERAKRVSESRREIQDLSGDLSRYLEDPHSTPVPRERLEDEVQVVVVGGGFGGLLLGARLREAGVGSVRIIDRAGDFGGTWYWNRYPGIMCDVESYIYMPLLEETGYIPTEKYAHGDEIREHSQRIARHYDLYRSACFHTGVTELRWDESRKRWIVSTDRGDEIAAQFVCMASGTLQKPRIPKIPGIETFKGHSFHTSRWDYDYTGGSSESADLPGLRDKRVGVIGTAATAVQVVPNVARSAEHLYVFQRTPAAVAVRANRPTDLEWAASLKPGWQKERQTNFSELVSGGEVSADLVADGWTKYVKALVPASRGVGVDEQDAVVLADLTVMEELRSRIDRIVADKTTAEALKPYYNWFCKRPCFHDEYLDAFNRPNVTLIDTEGRGVEAITAGGVVANGVEIQLDCLIHATGFEINNDYELQTGYRVVGQDGTTLTEKWSNGISTLHGCMTSGFPNLFFSPQLNRSQAALNFNAGQALDEYATHAAFIIGHCIDHHITHCNVDHDAETAWVQTVLERSRVRREFLKACTPGYFNNEGRPDDIPPQNTTFGGSSGEFYTLLKKWRETLTFEGLHLQP